MCAIRSTSICSLTSWLLIHNSHLTTTISTRVVTAPNVNCGDKVGRAAAAKLAGVPFRDTKVKRGDRAINMAMRAQELMLLFDACMKPLVPQHSFLRNPSYLTNKTRLISITAQCIANNSVQCKQAEGDTDRLTVSTDQEVSNPVLAVATQHSAHAGEPGQWHTGVYMGQGLAACVNVLNNQE